MVRLEDSANPTVRCPQRLEAAATSGLHELSPGGHDDSTIFPNSQLAVLRGVCDECATMGLVCGRMSVSGGDRAGANRRGKTRLDLAVKFVGIQDFKLS